MLAAFLETAGTAPVLPGRPRRPESATYAGTPTGPNLISQRVLPGPSVEERAQSPSGRVRPKSRGGRSGATECKRRRATTGRRQRVAASLSGLRAAATATLSQTVNTTFGDLYLLRWSLAADYNCGPAIKRMGVFWEGKLVSVPTFNMTGNGKSWMGWTSQQIIVTAATTSSVVEFTDATAGNGQCGASLDEVSLRLDTDTSMGSQLRTPLTRTAWRSVKCWPKLPAHAVVTNAGAPVCSIQAAAAEQINNGGGLLIIWWVTPSSQFIKSTAHAQQADAQALKQYICNVLKTSGATYIAALKADRVPIQGDADLAIWWEVRVQSTSTTIPPYELPDLEFRILNLGSLGQGPIGSVQRATLMPR